MDETTRAAEAAQVGRWVDTAEAADILDVSQRTVRRWIKTGRLRATRTDGGQRLVLVPGDGPPMAMRRDDEDDGEDGGITEGAGASTRGRRAGDETIDQDDAAATDEDTTDRMPVPHADGLAGGSPAAAAIELRAASLAIAEADRTITVYRERIDALEVDARHARRHARVATAAAVLLMTGLVVVAAVSITRRTADSERITALSGDLEAERDATDAIRTDLVTARERLAEAAARVDGLESTLAIQTIRAERAEASEGAEARRATGAEDELHRVRRELDALRGAVADRDQLVIETLVGRLDQLELTLAGVESVLTDPRPLAGPLPVDGPAAEAAASDRPAPWSPTVEVAPASPREPAAAPPAMATPERSLPPSDAGAGASPSAPPSRPDDSTASATEVSALPSWIVLPAPKPVAPESAGTGGGAGDEDGSGGDVEVEPTTGPSDIAD